MAPACRHQTKKERAEKKNDPERELFMSHTATMITESKLDFNENEDAKRY